MAKAYSKLCENWAIDPVESRADFEWLQGDQRDEQGRLTRELGILKPGGNLIRLFRKRFEDGAFMGFYDEKGRIFSGNVSVSKTDFFFDDNADMLRKIGGRIREARTQKGLTGRELGELLGYEGSNGERYVHNWETGVRPVVRAKIRPLAELLDLSMDDLLP